MRMHASFLQLFDPPVPPLPPEEDVTTKRRGRSKTAGKLGCMCLLTQTLVPPLPAEDTKQGGRSKTAGKLVKLIGCTCSCKECALF